MRPQPSVAPPKDMLSGFLQDQISLLFSLRRELSAVRTGGLQEQLRGFDGAFHYSCYVGNSQDGIELTRNRGQEFSPGVLQNFRASAVMQSSVGPMGALGGFLGSVALLVGDIFFCVMFLRMFFSLFRHYRSYKILVDTPVIEI